MNEDRFKALEEKVKHLENENDKLENAVRHLTEAMMIMIEHEEAAEDETMGPGNTATYIGNT